MVNFTLLDSLFPSCYTQKGGTTLWLCLLWRNRLKAVIRMYNKDWMHFLLGVFLIYQYYLMSFIYWGCKKMTSHCVYTAMKITSIKISPCESFWKHLGALVSIRELHFSIHYCGEQESFSPIISPLRVFYVSFMKI